MDKTETPCCDKFVLKERVNPYTNKETISRAQEIIQRVQEIERRSQV